MIVETSKIASPRVFDPLLRGLHWILAGSILTLIATSQLAELFEDGPLEDALWQSHIFAGYVMAAALGARLVWGVIGPEAARWRDFWHPAAWRGMLKGRWPASRRGHDAAASLGYLAAYAVMALMVGTGLGLAAIEFQAGPLSSVLGGARGLGDLFEEPHEFGFALMLGFIALHLAALVVHQWRGERVAQSMVTGRQYHESEGAEHGQA